MRLLAVDDDESILSLLDHALTCSGDHDLTTARSAKEALESINRSGSGFDCLLIDIQMPEVDGIKLTEVIRKTPGYERNPVLMLTAMHDKSYLDRAFHAGATDYLTKPFDFKNLQSRIFDAQALACEKFRSAALDNSPQNVRWIRGVARDACPDQVIASVNGDGLIAYGEFDNYIHEMARRPKCKAVVMAVKMAAPALDRTETSMEEFSAMLGQSVACTRAALPSYLSFFSYRGNGILLCLMEQDPSIPREMIESDINARFAKIPAQASFSDVRLFVGDLTPIRTSSDAEVFESQWQATDSVERRFAATKEIIISRHILNQGLLTEEQHRLKRKAYKSVMRQMLSDVEDEHWLAKLYRRARQRKD